MPRFRQLPPLNSLVYFEAAARLGSFTRAAEELNVTQGAVSRQVQRLEEHLGCSLFVRAGRRILLSDEGHNYHVSIADILGQLAASTQGLRGEPEAQQVTVATSSALATFYLLPRIPAFQRTHEDIQIRIIARVKVSYAHSISLLVGSLDMLFNTITLQLSKPRRNGLHESSIPARRDRSLLP